MRQREEINVLGTLLLHCVSRKALSKPRLVRSLISSLVHTLYVTGTDAAKAKSKAVRNRDFS